MNARNDHKLKTFMSSFGRNWREGYFYFFSLLELCGSAAQEGEKEHTFHVNTLRELWGTSTKGVHDVCNKCASSALVMCNIGTTHVTFSLPNLLNYVGRYEKSAPNKENKIKEIKENKETEVTPPFVEILNSEPETESNVINTGLFTGDALHTIEELPVSDLQRNILTLLNTICFRNFRPNKANLRLISARINDGYTLDDFKKVFEYKQREWGADSKFKTYLQPTTLLGTKFDQYLNQALASDSMSTEEQDAIIARFFPGA